MWLEYMYKNPYTAQPAIDYFESDADTLTEALFDLHSRNYFKGNIVAVSVVQKPSHDHCVELLKSLQQKLDSIDREIQKVLEYMNDTE